MSVSLRTIFLTGTAMLLLAGHSIAQRLPQKIVGDLYPWRAVDVVLDEAGNVASDLAPDQHEVLTHQIRVFRDRFGSAAEHGLVEGQIPSEGFCAPSLTTGGYYAMSVKPDNLDAAIALSEVAVMATISEMVAGFQYGPTALVVLEQVEPLHPYSPSPDYALIPLGRMVARDVVFCGSRGPYSTSTTFEGRPGDRIIVVGSWDRGVAIVGSEPSLLASFPEESEPLRWTIGKGPSSAAQLENRISRIVSSGLYEYAADARRADRATDEGYAKWEAVGLEIQAAMDEGCDLAGADQTAEGWTLRKVCEQ
ncbi:MAG: hypothetical protein OXU63_05905 [Acidobacteriota bacterium]|nr:hypothetical protein [Acidobacteriota bacterium]